MFPDPVLVIGDSMLDRYWEGSVERISPEAPVPVLRFGCEWQRAGGAANVALNLAALQGHVTLATLLGQDEAAAQLSGLVERGGVRLRAVQCAQVPTTQKIRTVCRRQQLLRIDIEDAAPPDAARALCTRAKALLPTHPWVVFSDYGKGALGHCAELLSEARAHGCRTLVDPQGHDVERYQGAWLLKPNEAEARALAGPWADEQGFVHTMGALRARLRLRHLLVTRGERGMALFSEGRPPLHIATEAREVFDVSGAGDTALAALAAALAAGQPLDEAVRQANRAAGLAVGKFGTAVVSASELRGA